MSMSDMREALEGAFDTLSGVTPEKVETPIEPTEPPLPEGELVDTPKEVLKETPKPVDDGLKYPRSWSKEYFGEYDKLPDNIKTYLKQRDREINAEIKRAQDAEREVRGSHEPLMKTLEPYAKEWEGVGVDVQSGIKELAEFERMARKEPIQAINHILKAHGATFEDLFQSLQNQGAQQGTVDPRILQKLEAIERETQALKQERHSNEVNRQLRNVDEFAKDKPLFNEVAEDMVRYVQMGHDLERAYLLAVSDNPAIKATYEQQLFDNRLKEKNAKAQEAKKAAFNPTNRSANVSPSKAPVKDFRSSIEEAFDAVSNKI